MKNVFLVLNGDEQKYFIEQKNAENHVKKNDGELFEEEVREKRFKELLSQKDFFLDAPEMKVVKEQKDNKNKANNTELARQLEALQSENEKLKQQQSLSFKDAADLYRKKAKFLDDIAVFESVSNTINEVTQKLDNTEELKSDYYSIKLLGGYHSHKDTIFSISNIEFVQSFNDFVKERIELKISELKEEVQAI